MAQLRRDYEQFTSRDAEVLVVGPDDQEAFRDYWHRESLPFVGLADPEHWVADRFGQEVRLHKLGRMPALMVIDKTGLVRFRHYASAMFDIPPNPQVLAVLDGLNRAQA